MHFALKLTQISNSVGMILPKEVLTRMALEAGDTIYLTESPEGYRIVKGSPVLEEQLRLGKEIMERHRDVLRELAK